MAASARHKGWLFKPNEGILAAVNIGAKSGAVVLATNTALDGVLVGTPVTPALAVDSIVISNEVASGDILVAANNGGNSQAWLWVDASAGTMRLYGAGTAVVELAATYAQVLDDILLGLGTGNTARLSWDTTDANANELLIQLPAGGAVDVPVVVIGQSVESVDLGLFNGIVDPTVALFGVGAVATGTGLRFYKARGTVAAPTVCTTGDDVMTFRGYAAVAAGEYVQTAEIRFDVAGTIATTRGPGTITFLTATDAAPSVLTTALTISAAQLCTFAADIQGNTRIDIGVAGTTTGIVAIDGATSGTVSMTVAATAGTWTFTLPATAGEAADVLVTDGTGISSWVAGMRSVDVQLTNAQLLALLGTDITLVAAPGANRAIVVHAIYLFFDVTTTAYTINAGATSIGYASDGVNIAVVTEAGLLDTVADSGRWYQIGAAVATPNIITPVANAAVVIRKATADMTGGNAANTLSIRVYYSVVDFVAFT